MSRVAVVLPSHLRTLAGVTGDVVVDVPGQPTVATVLDALEARHPVLRGTIRDRATHERRAFIRYFACDADLSLVPADTALPEPVARGREVFRVVAAIAGG